MVVLVSTTTKTKPFHVPANSLGLETDAKLRKVITNLLYIQCTDVTEVHTESSFTLLSQHRG